jgi:hypothetical protein
MKEDKIVKGNYYKGEINFLRGIKIFILLIVGNFSFFKLNIFVFLNIAFCLLFFITLP